MIPGHSSYFISFLSDSKAAGRLHAPQAIHHMDDPLMYLYAYILTPLLRYAPVWVLPCIVVACACDPIILLHHVPV